MDNRLLALLTGLAVGDATGVPVEFQRRGTFHVTDMQGYGTHNQPPGTWSDDTSLTLALADRIRPDKEGYPVLSDIAQGFVDWYFHAAYTPHGKVFDVGNATAKAITRLKQGVPPVQAGVRGEHENGNGGLMRIAPLALYLEGLGGREKRFAIVRDISSLTHAHPWSVAACVLFVEYLDRLCQGQDKQAAYEKLRKDFAHGHPCISQATLAKFARILTKDIREISEREISGSGFVIHTLEASLWAFLTTDNYRDAVLKAVNLGDDTDTTGAVTGALAGLYYGYEAIPLEWRTMLAAREMIESIADKMPCWGREAR